MTNNTFTYYMKIATIKVTKMIEVYKVTFTILNFNVVFMHVVVQLWQLTSGNIWK